MLFRTLVCCVLSSLPLFVSVPLKLFNTEDTSALDQLFLRILAVMRLVVPPPFP